MSFPQQQWAHRIPNPLLQAEQYNVDEMATLVDKQRAIFNPDQAAVFNAVLESVTNNQGYLFFIHAASGCGKIFLCNTIAAEVRRRDQVVLYVMNIKWNYGYYQPWSDNEWLVDEMIALMDEDITMHAVMH